MLSQSKAPNHELNQAIEYMVLSDGKRFRAHLIYAMGQVVEVPQHICDALACAVELIHTYSLIHDDLPALDNDPIRRGQASCHVKFNEATAILCGDALMAMAFEALTTLKSNPQQVVAAIRLFSQTIGPQQMVAGQMIDLDTHKAHDQATLEQMHQLKTGRLISFCIESPLIMSALPLTDQQRNILIEFGECLGLAFQIRDDILDCTASYDTIGKTPGKDQIQNKLTYPALLGLTHAQALLKKTLKEIKLKLGTLPFDCAPLLALTDVLADASDAS